MNIWKITDKNKISRSERKIEENPALIKVRVARAALTETDFFAYAGLTSADFPIIPSKSAIGLISNAENPLGLKVGERVLLSAYTPCGECKQERDTTRPYCTKPTVRGVDCDGFLSDFAYVDKNSVFPIPETVTDTECLYYEYISVGLATMERLRIEKGEYVVVLGGDIQSLVFAEIVNYYQAIPIVISKSDDSLRQANKNGIDYVINSKKTDVIDKVFEITGGKMAEHVVYSVYSGEAYDELLHLARTNGHVGIIGYNRQTAPLNLDTSELVNRQLSLYGIKEGMKEVTSSINMLAMKSIHTDIYKTTKISFASVENILSGYKPGANPGLIIVDCNDA